MHLRQASLVSEDALPARDVVFGQVVMSDGQLVSTDRELAVPASFAFPSCRVFARRMARRQTAGRFSLCVRPIDHGDGHSDHELAGR